MSKLTVSGGKVTLKPQRYAAKMPGRGIFYFPLDDGLFVRTSSFAPTALVTWDFIEVFSKRPKDENLNAPTSVLVRIFDGTNSLFWDGASWSVAASTDWNTETVLNANLSAYTGASLAIEARLKTTDKTLTPIVESIGLRWTGKVVKVLDALLYDGIVASLEDNLRPLKEWVQPGNGTTSISLGVELGDVKYRITDVIEAYNHTTDPTHQTNLLVSFSGGVATLSSAVPADEKIWFFVEHSVTIAVTTSSDFTIGAIIPAIWITQISPQPRKQIGGSGPHILDRTLSVPAGSVYLNPIPFRDVNFTFVIITPSATDLLALGEAFEGWVSSHPLIDIHALGLRVSLRAGIVPDWDTTTTDEDDTRLATGTFIIKNVPAFSDPRVSAASDASAKVGPVDAGDPAFPGIGYGISRLNLNFFTDEGGDETKTVSE